jgi:hypothetical protein
LSNSRREVPATPLVRNALPRGYRDDTFVFTQSRERRDGVKCGRHKEGAEPVAGRLECCGLRPEDGRKIRNPEFAIRNSERYDFACFS